MSQFTPKQTKRHQWGTHPSPDTVHRPPLVSVCNLTDYKALGFIQDSLNHLLMVIQAKHENAFPVDKVNDLLQKFAGREEVWQERYSTLEKETVLSRVALQKQVLRLKQQVSTYQQEISTLNLRLQESSSDTNFLRLQEAERKLKEFQSIRRQLQEKLFSSSQEIKMLRNQKRVVSEPSEYDIGRDSSNGSINYQKQLQVRLNQALRTVEQTQKQKADLELRCQEHRRLGLLEEQKIFDMRAKLQGIQNKYREYEKSLALLQNEKQRERDEKQSQKRMRLQLESEFKAFRQRTDDRIEKAKQKQLLANQTLRDIRAQFKTLQSDYSTKLKAKKTQLSNSQTVRLKALADVQRLQEQLSGSRRQEQLLAQQLKFLKESNVLHHSKEISERDQKLRQLQQKIARESRLSADWQFQVQQLKIQNYRLTQKLGIKQNQIKHLLQRVSQLANSKVTAQAQTHSSLRVSKREQKTDRTQRSERSERAQSRIIQLQTEREIQRYTQRIASLQRENAQLHFELTGLREQQNFSFAEGEDKRDGESQTDTSDLQEYCLKLEVEVMSLKGMLGWCTNEYEKLKKSQRGDDLSSELTSARKDNFQSIDFADS